MPTEDGKVFFKWYDKNVDFSKMKAVADDNSDLVQMMLFFFDSVENIYEKG